MYYIPEPLNPKKDLGRFSATCFTYLWVMLGSVFIYAFVAFFVISEDTKNAEVTICSDMTQLTSTDFQGNDVTQESTQRRLAISVHMVPRDDGVWITQSETRLSINECTAEAGK